MQVMSNVRERMSATCTGPWKLRAVYAADPALASSRQSCCCEHPLSLFVQETCNEEE